MLKVNVKRSADSLLRELAGRGLVVKLETVEAKRNARHWHLGFANSPACRRVTDLGDSCELKVAAKRHGCWAKEWTRELANLGR